MGAQTKSLAGEGAASVDDEPALPLDQAKALLDERAQALAQRSSEAPREELLEVLTFALGRERYAIETRSVREVAPLTEFTPVPSAPAFIVGIVSLRGEVLTIVDLRKLFSADSVGLTDLSRVIVVGSERAELGVLADSVHTIEHLPSRAVLDAPAAAAGAGREYLRGLTGDAWIILDAEALLDDERFVVDQNEKTKDR